VRDGHFALWRGRTVNERRICMRPNKISSVCCGREHEMQIVDAKKMCEYFEKTHGTTSGLYLDRVGQWRSRSRSWHWQGIPCRCGKAVVDRPTDAVGHHGVRGQVVPSCCHMSTHAANVVTEASEADWSIDRPESASGSRLTLQVEPERPTLSIEVIMQSSAARARGLEMPPVAALHDSYVE
jgi:hypothetical protein